MLDKTGRERFGAYLKSLRDKVDLSLREVAEAANVSSPYLSQIEKGLRNPPSAEMLGRLARLYQVPEETMLKEAGYLEGGSSDIPEDVILRAFDFVCKDKNFAFGTRLRGDELSLEAKAYIVEVYQKATKRTILRKDELAAILKEE